MAGGLRIRGGGAVVAPRVLEFQWGDIRLGGEHGLVSGEISQSEARGGIKGVADVGAGKITPRTKPAWAEGAGGTLRQRWGEKKK